MSYLIYDIETIPKTELAEHWKPSEPGEFPPLDCHKIVSIGMLLLDHNLQYVKAGNAAGMFIHPRPESEMIHSFRNAATRGSTAMVRLVDFNGRGFDMPVIQLRALALGISLPFYFEKQPDNRGGISMWSKCYRDRYAGFHIDLCEEWCNFGASRRPSLDTLAKLCGLPGKMDVDGSDVLTLYEQGLYETIDRYCMEDVYQTAILFIRWLALKGEIQDAARLIRPILDSISPKKHPAFTAAINKNRERILCL